MTDRSESSPLVASTALARWGRASWLLIGILLVASIIYSALAAISGLVVPLVIAVVIGMLAAPLVDPLERRRLPRPAGAVLVLLGILVAVIGSGVIAVNGVIDQGDEITRQLTAGLGQIDAWLEDLDVDAGAADERFEQARQLGVDAIPGLAGWFTTAFTSVVSLVAGGLLALFLLYFILSDWDRVWDWVEGNLGVPSEL